MGYFFENMEPMDIQAERRNTAEQRKRAEAAEKKIEAAEEKAEAAEKKAEAAEEKAEAAREKTEEAKERAAKEKKRAEAAENQLSILKEEEIAAAISIIRDFTSDRSRAKKIIMEKYGLGGGIAEDKLKKYWD